MSAAFIRILLRYLAGVLVTRGLLSSDDGNWITSDPDIAMILETGAGLMIASADELWYMLAKRLGWRT